MKSSLGMTFSMDWTTIQTLSMVGKSFTAVCSVTCQNKGKRGCSIKWVWGIPLSFSCAWSLEVWFSLPSSVFARRYRLICPCPPESVQHSITWTAKEIGVQVVRVCVCVCMCTQVIHARVSACMCMCSCMPAYVCAYVCVCLCVRVFHM